MAHSHAPEPLPAVVYSIVAPEALLPARVTDHQVESFGFNNGAEWDGNRGGDKSQVEGRYLRWLRESGPALRWGQLRRGNLCLDASRRAMTS